MNNLPTSLHAHRLQNEQTGEETQGAAPASPADNQLATDNAGNIRSEGSLRILTADGDPAMQRFYKEAIPALGHEVFVVGTGRELADLCRDVRPELVITDLKLPELDALAVAAQVCRDWTIPFIIVSECHDPEIIRGSPDGPVLAYLVKPIHQNSLGPAITVAMQCFQRMRALWDEAARLRQTVEDRKLIERAKGMVMKYAGLNEEAAFNRMRKMASDQNRKLAEIAHAIITSGEVFHQLEKVGECQASNGGPARRVKGRRPAWHDYHDGHDERTPRYAD